MKAYRRRARFYSFALLCLTSVALMIGCDDDSDESSTRPETVTLVVTNSTQAEEVIFLTTNAARTSRGKPPLKQDARLRELARRYSQLMLERNFISHVTPDGKTLSDRFADFGIRYRFIAENLARYEGVFQTIPTNEVVDGWLNSPGHRVNLLDEKNRGFTHLGLGVASGKSPTSSQPVYYYTQLFWLP